jgi:hypothetical protein
LPPANHSGGFRQDVDIEASPAGLVDALNGMMLWHWLNQTSMGNVSVAIN